ncbi:MAG: hypothetical protein H6554_03940 [Chitinophagales bacterium]|nr:hypothetical protein [Chitinophagales bacterium]
MNLLYQAGYYSGSTVTSTCPDGTGTVYPNFILNSRSGEQLALLMEQVILPILFMP